jgi:hypothetical protein
MSKPTIRIYQGDGEFIDREMTNSEFTQYKKDQEVFAKEKAEAEAKAIQRQAILDRLGLTSEEASLLLS